MLSGQEAGGIAKPDQIDVLADAVFGDAEEVGHVLETGTSRQGPA
jgi:hypothetical protein